MQQWRNGRVQWQMSQAPYRAVQRAVLRGAERVWHDLRFHDGWFRAWAENRWAHRHPGASAT